MRMTMVGWAGEAGPRHEVVGMTAKQQDTAARRGWHGEYVVCTHHVSISNRDMPCTGHIESRHLAVMRLGRHRRPWHLLERTTRRMNRVKSEHRRILRVQ